MLLIVLVIFSFILVTFCLGDLLLKVSKLFKSEINISVYLFQDKIFIGIFLLTFFLSIINLYRSINQSVLIPLLIGSLLYLSYLIGKKKLRIHIKKNILIWCCIALLFTLFTTVIVTDSWDSKYYHMQFIESLYRFPLIKGLGNLEDRFGFNSSVFVLYSLFGFKNLIGFHLFELNSIIFLLILWYLIYQLCNKYNTANLFQLIILTLFYALQGKLMDTTSNDITVILLAYYLTIRFLALPDKFYDLALLFVFIPCLMTSSKLSSIFFLFLSFLLLIYLVKKQYTYTAIFSAIVSIAFFAVWFYRNVYISGYLIYPISSIDLFNVSWKVPNVVAITQKEYIHGFACGELKDFFAKIFIPKYALKIPFILLLLVNLSIILIPFFFSSIFRNKKYYTIIVLSFLCGGLLFSLVQAPDFRFYSLYYYPIMIIGGSSLLVKKRWVKSKNYIVVACIILTIGTFYGFKKKSIKYHLTETHQVSNMLLSPVLGINTYRIPKSELIVSDKAKIYKIGSTDTKELSYYHNYELFPSTSETGYYTNNSPADGIRIQPLESIELIGSSIEDGFKTKENWKKKLTTDKSQLIASYQKNLEKRLSTEREKLNKDRIGAKEKILTHKKDENQHRQNDESPNHFDVESLLSSQFKENAIQKNLPLVDMFSSTEKQETKDIKE